MADPPHLRVVRGDDRRKRSLPPEELLRGVVDESESSPTIILGVDMWQAGDRLKSWWVQLREWLNEDMERSRPPRRERDGDEVIAHQASMDKVLAEDRELASALHHVAVPHDECPRGLDGGNPAAVRIVEASVGKLAEHLEISPSIPVAWREGVAAGWPKDPQIYMQEKLDRLRAARFAETYERMHGKKPPRAVQVNFDAIAGLQKPKRRASSRPALRLRLAEDTILAVLRAKSDGMGRMAIVTAASLPIKVVTAALSALVQAGRARVDDSNYRKHLWFPA